MLRLSYSPSTRVINYSVSAALYTGMLAVIFNIIGQHQHQSGYLIAADADCGVRRVCYVNVVNVNVNV
jgi:hypothetical protein